MGPAEYQDNAAQIITNPTPCFAAGIRHSGLQASLGVLQKQARPDFRNNMKDDSPPYYVFPVIRRTGFIAITPLLCLLALFPLIRGLAMAALPWMLDV